MVKSMNWLEALIFRTGGKGPKVLQNVHSQFGKSGPHKLLSCLEKLQRGKSRTQIPKSKYIYIIQDIESTLYTSVNPVKLFKCVNSVNWL